MAKAVKLNPVEEAEKTAPKILTIGERKFKFVNWENQLTNRQIIKLEDLTTPLIEGIVATSQGGATMYDVSKLSRKLQFDIFATLYINSDEVVFSEDTFSERKEIFLDANDSVFDFGGDLISHFLPSYLKRIMADSQTFFKAIEKIAPKEK